MLASLALALCVGGLLPATGHAQSRTATAQKAKQERLVLQMSDGDPTKWNLVLNNAENVQQALGAKNVTVEIVAYGPGLDMLKAESRWPTG